MIKHVVTPIDVPTIEPENIKGYDFNPKTILCDIYLQKKRVWVKLTQFLKY